VLWLASTSPRRRDLLRAAGIAFEPTEPGPEPAGDGPPRQRAVQRARAKADGAAARDGLVLGVDTVVELDGVEIGQAADPGEARAALLALSGREHRVHTAHCLLARGSGRRAEAVATARVRCAVLQPAQLERYLASGAWRGKAGSYGIQDAECGFMELVAGERDTVVGLSLRCVRQLLAELGAP
jgi:septum formation protein